MHPVASYPLWLGHAGDARDMAAVRSAGILAVVDLALNEPPAHFDREMTCCRWPLIDGEGNPPWIVEGVVETVALLVRSKVPTLVCCSAGLSRSIAVAAGAIARVTGQSPADVLAQVAATGPADVSPALWREVTAYAGSP